MSLVNLRKLNSVWKYLERFAKAASISIKWKICVQKSIERIHSFLVILNSEEIGVNNDVRLAETHCLHKKMAQRINNHITQARWSQPIQIASLIYLIFGHMHKSLSTVSWPLISKLLILVLRSGPLKRGKISAKVFFFFGSDNVQY